jgi:hypothetical protein
MTSTSNVEDAMLMSSFHVSELLEYDEYQVLTSSCKQSSSMSDGKKIFYSISCEKYWTMF